eukprot:31542-Chlamydomonas_euryale.AAC.1
MLIFTFVWLNELGEGFRRLAHPHRYSPAKKTFSGPYAFLSFPHVAVVEVGYERVDPELGGPSIAWAGTSSCRPMPCTPLLLEHGCAAQLIHNVHVQSHMRAVTERRPCRKELLRGCPLITPASAARSCRTEWAHAHVRARMHAQAQANNTDVCRDSSDDGRLWRPRLRAWPI